MPTSYIKKLSKEGRGTVPELEKKWDKAEDLADTQDQGDNYAYRTAIFKNLVGAAARINAYAPQPGSSMGQVSKGWPTVAQDNNYLDSLVESGQFTREEVDNAWAAAKKKANEAADENPNIVPSYAYTTAIFQDILGIKNRDPSSPPATTAALKIKASIRLSAATKEQAKTLADLIVKLFSSKGHTAKIKENKLLNRQLKGPAGGTHFSIETTASYGDAVDLIEMAGWVHSDTKRDWRKRGAPTVGIGRTAEGSQLWLS